VEIAVVQDRLAQEEVVFQVAQANHILNVIMEMYIGIIVVIKEKQ
jgi:hypothetical protein